VGVGAVCPHSSSQGVGAVCPHSSSQMKSKEERGSAFLVLILPRRWNARVRVGVLLYSFFLESKGNMGMFCPYSPSQMESKRECRTVCSLVGCRLIVILLIAGVQSDRGLCSFDRDSSDCCVQSHCSCTVLRSRLSKYQYI
jgi:hypothetical protein